MQSSSPAADKADVGNTICRTWLGVCAGLATALLAIDAQPRAAAPGPGGIVEGHVTVVSRPSRRLSSAGAYPGRTVTAGPVPGGSELANVVVFIDLPAGLRTAPGRAAIRQVDEVFSPGMIAVATGTTVEFPNDDPIFHNVFSLSRAATFDLGRYPRGESRSRRFDQPGVVKVFCHFHSHMSAVIRVFDHPYFAIPDDSGRVVIPGVPPGTHRVVAWHERVGEVAHGLSVVDGSTATVTFALPLTDRQ